MKLYRHYKNKLYRYKGIVRHSESLEEHVLYEALYKNEDRLWVRPKGMFFEDIELNGQTRPRFEKLEPRLDSQTSLTPRQRAEIEELSKSCFPVWETAYFDQRWAKAKNPQAALAYVDEQLIAYKIGYEESPRTFYSWLGAVHPDYRGSGIACDLMGVQHRWAQSQGYTRILTKTMNDNLPMIKLNLKHGFRVVGLEEVPEGLKLSLVKPL